MQTLFNSRGKQEVDAVFLLILGLPPMADEQTSEVQSVFSSKKEKHSVNPLQYYVYLLL
jgi:hypothetical protein